MNRYYLFPVIGKGFSHTSARRPKYLDAYAGLPAVEGKQYLYYGQLPVVLVHLPNVDQATHDELTANPDVIAFPLNLASTVGGNLATVKNALEAALVPSEWVNGGTTYAEILTRMQKLFIFTQRFQAWLKHRILTALWDNDTLLQDLPGFLLEDIQDTCDSLGISYAGITADMSIRDAVAILSQRV